MAPREQLRRPRGKSSDGGGGGTRFVWPTSPKVGVSGAFLGAGSDHEGVDIPNQCGDKMIAVADGVVSGVFSDPAGYGTYFDIDLGGGITVRYAHGPAKVKKGDRVQQGDIVGTVGQEGNSTGCHLHFEVHENGTPVDPVPYLEGAKAVDGNATSGGGAGATGDDTESVAKAAAISTYLQFPALMISEESMALKGDRSLMNDQQLLPFIEQLCQASLRNFQSMPNGNFFAFYPDYFGGLNHRTPYWEISDVEIISGKIDLSDDALVTHMYVVGDTDTFDGQVDILDKLRSAGIVSVFTAFMADFLNGVSSPALQNSDSKRSKGERKNREKDYERALERLPTLAKEERAIAFLKKYGARPAFEAAPMVRTPFFEKFLAYQKFCLAWSRQFLTTFEFTFMPELFPGGLVAFPEHGIQCYIDEVVHECDYQGGFVTRANLSAPAAIKDKNGIRRGPRKYVHEGMIRGHLFANAEKDGKRGKDDKGRGGKQD